jgi:hypothetical protein
MISAPGPDGVSQPGPSHLLFGRPDDGWKLQLDLGSAELALSRAYKPKHGENNTPQFTKN